MDNIVPPGSDAPGVFTIQIHEVELLKKQIAELAADKVKIKEMAREGQKKGEIAKHKSPQIKRSLGFLYEVNWGLEDAEEALDSLSTYAVASENAELYSEKITATISKLKKLQELVKDEVTANKIASKANFGWKTVKLFENDSIFEGENAESLSKKLKSAEYQASREYFRGKRGFSGKRRFSGKPSRWDSSPAPAASSTTASVTSAPVKLCYKCNLPGHFQLKCPN